MQPGYLIPIFGENDFDFYSGFNREPVKRSQCWGGGGRNGHIMFKMIIQHCNCIWVMINSEQHSRISVGDKKLYIPICFYSRCMTQPTQWNKPWGRMKKVGGKKDSGVGKKVGHMLGVLWHQRNRSKQSHGCHVINARDEEEISWWGNMICFGLFVSYGIGET